MDKSGLKQNELQMLSWAEERLEVDRYRLQQKFPFWGNFLMRTEIEVGHWDDIPTACTNGKSIFVNVLFYATLNEEERLFVLAHEATHCMMMHFLRIQKRDPSIWNIASDLEIHFLLTKEKMVPPFVLPHDPSWDGLSAEQIYEFLLEESEKNKEEKKGKNGEGSSLSGNSGKNGSSGRSSGRKDPFGRKGLKESSGVKSLGTTEGGLQKGFDSLVQDGRNPNDSEKFDADEVQNEILSRIQASAEATERTRGTVPGAVKDILKEFSKREVNWRQMLSQFVTSTFSGSRRWLPPNRRYVHRGMYLPSMHEESLRAVVALDTSGSCCGDLPKFFSELEGLLASFGKYQITVLQCDAEIQSVEEFSDSNPIPPGKKWEVKGYGGTSFCPVFDFVKKHPELEPSCLVFLTDGWGDAPKDPPPYPVLWMLVADGSRDFCRWGTKVRFKET